MTSSANSLSPLLGPELEAGSCITVRVARPASRNYPGGGTDESQFLDLEADENDEED
jgi:hypothetical protein